MNRVRGQVGFPALFVALAALAAGGCATSSSLVDLWRDPAAPSPRVRDVLVVAMKRDAMMRHIWEDTFVAELERRGVSATPSYREFPDAPPDTDQIVEAVRSHGYDGVIAAHRLSSETEQRYVPGYVTYQPVERFNRWTNAYYTYYREIREPGYVETDKVVRYRVEVWSTADPGRLVWSGTTETIDPASSRDASREISRLIVPQLANNGVIASRKRG